MSSTPTLPLSLFVKVFAQPHIFMEIVSWLKLTDLLGSAEGHAAL